MAAFALLLDFLCLKCCPSWSLSSVPQPNEKATVRDNSHRQKADQGRNGTHGTECGASSAIYHLHIQMKAPNLYTLIGQPTERCPRNLCKWQMPILLSCWTIVQPVQRYVSRLANSRVQNFCCPPWECLCLFTMDSYSKKNKMTEKEITCLTRVCTLFR